MRQASYQLQQEREAVRSGRATESALREQVQRLEERLAREMEQRQAAELLRREAELQARSHLVLSQQLQDHLSELSSRLQAEKEARAVQVSPLRERRQVLGVEMYPPLGVTLGSVQLITILLWLCTGGAVQGTAATVSGAAERVRQNAGAED